MKVVVLFPFPHRCPDRDVELPVALVVVEPAPQHEHRRRLRAGLQGELFPGVAPDDLVGDLGVWGAGLVAVQGGDAAEHGDA